MLNELFVHRLIAILIIECVENFYSLVLKAVAVNFSLVNYKAHRENVFDNGNNNEFTCLEKFPCQFLFFLSVSVVFFLIPKL